MDGLYGAAVTPAFTQIITLFIFKFTQNGKEPKSLTNSIFFSHAVSPLGIIPAQLRPFLFIFCKKYRQKLCPEMICVLSCRFYASNFIRWTGLYLRMNYCGIYYGKRLLFVIL